jgi:hypothetical protein
MVQRQRPRAVRNDAEDLGSRMSWMLVIAVT